MIKFSKQIIVACMSMLIAGSLNAQMPRFIPGTNVALLSLTWLARSGPHTPLEQVLRADGVVFHDLNSEPGQFRRVQQFPLVQQRRAGPMTELHKAVMRGDQDGDQKNVKELIESGSDINAPGNFGWSPLHFAIELGHIHVIRLLLALGADFELCDMFGQRPLHKAAARGFEEAVKALLQKGARKNVRTIAGSTPFDFAHQNQHQGVILLLVRRVQPETT